MSPPSPSRALGAAIAALVVVQAVTVTVHSSPPESGGAALAAAPEREDAEPSPGPGSPARRDSAAIAATLPAVMAEGATATEGSATGNRQPSAVTPGRVDATDQASGRATRPSGPAAERAPRDPARTRFERQFPGHAVAQQDAGDPATTRWAVLVGINEHQGRVRDNVGSRQDAEELWRHLINLGWREDHVLLLTDATATYENITQAIAWLGRKTDDHSVAIFHYSGHTKKYYGQDADGDGEVTDEALWPSDNRYLIDSEWVQRMRAVDAGRLWIDIGGCEAAGLNDPGLERPGRLLTFSSTESEKSYEWPGRSNSVWGYYLVDQALLHGDGDLDGDGNVTVEEAFNYAAPRARDRTDDQRYGAQHAVVIDHLDGDLDLRIPRAPAPRSEPEPGHDDDGGGSDGGDGGCTLVCGTAPRRT